MWVGIRCAKCGTRGCLTVLFLPLKLNNFPVLVHALGLFLLLFLYLIANVMPTLCTRDLFYSEMTYLILEFCGGNNNWPKFSTGYNFWRSTPFFCGS